MGLHVRVFSDRLGDCSNGGVSSRHSTLTVANIDGPFEPSDDAPAVLLLLGHYGSLKLVPFELRDKHTMFGGNIAYTSDSRLNAAARDMLCDPTAFICGIPIHDRVE